MLFAFLALAVLSCTCSFAIGFARDTCNGPLWFGPSVAFGSAATILVLTGAVR